MQTQSPPDDLTKHDLKPQSPAPPVRRRRRWWAWLLAIVIIAAIAFWYIGSRGNGTKSTTAASGTARGGRGSARGVAVPVAVSVAHRGDVPVYLDGLGNVIAFYTVTVHSRVDGQLMNVAVHEGDLVTQGQEIAQIDPRPYQVQLEQAQGQMAHDQALL